MRTSAQAGGRRSGRKGSNKGCEKQRIIRRKIWKLNENQTRVRFEKKSKSIKQRRA